MSGVDISPTGISMAQAACAQRNISIDARISDFSSLPWPDLTFDAALSIATIHHKRRAEIMRALAEVRRILKPGGIFLVDFPCVLSFTYQQQRQAVADGSSAEVKPNTFVDDRPDSDDPDGMLPHHFCDEADLRDLLASFDVIGLWANFQDITLESGEPGKNGKWIAWLRNHLLINVSSG